jgi:hypothetical protein
LEEEENMKKKFVGIVVLMLVATTVVSATNINVKETIQTKASGAILYCNNTIVDSQSTLFEWGVDQEQTDNCGHGIALTPPGIYAQSFTPTKDKLTAVRLYIFKYGSPPEPVHITVSIRDNLTQADLTTKTIDTSTVSIGIGKKAKWVLFDFDDITLTPGQYIFYRMFRGCR